MQLELLWKYMQTDMEAMNLENSLRNSPNRVKLLKDKNFILEQQENLKKIETEFSVMSDRIEALQDEYKRLEVALSETAKAQAEKPAETPEDVATYMQQVQKLLENLSRYEQELVKMRKDAENRDKQQRDIRVRAAKVKAEYEEIKKVYDVEFRDGKTQLLQLKTKTQEEAKKLPPTLLSKYNAIREHVTPPMAQLFGDQCGGCHMSLPSATTRRLDGTEIVECDNCGRILFRKTEEQE